MNTADELEDSVITVVPRGIATMEDLTGGSTQEETPAETTAATEPAAAEDPPLDAQPRGVGQKRPAGGFGRGADGGTSVFERFLLVITHARTTDCINEVLIDAEGSVTAAELGKLKTAAANARIRLNRKR
jgi:hypothetical protein